jgi:hypothetical protein
MRKLTIGSDDHVGARRARTPSKATPEPVSPATTALGDAPDDRSERDDADEDRAGEDHVAAHAVVTNL